MTTFGAILKLSKNLGNWNRLHKAANYQKLPVEIHFLGFSILLMLMMLVNGVSLDEGAVLLHGSRNDEHLAETLLAQSDNESFHF